MPDSTPEWTKVDEFLEKKKEEIPMYTPITEKLRDKIREMVSEAYPLSSDCNSELVDEMHRLFESELSELRESNRRQGEEIARLRLEKRITELRLERTDLALRLSFLDDQHPEREEIHVSDRQLQAELRKLMNPEKGESNY